MLEAALKRIYERNFRPMTDIEANLFHEFCKTYNRAADKGFSQATATPDDDFRNAIRYNNAVFAAFKTHRLQNDVAQQLLDSNGNLKPFEQWKKDVQSITSHQCDRWLRTEYNTAVLRARQAANWQQFRREADVLPNLEWVPSTSPNPGADHLPFWNTILPIDHPFWSQHRPGDRWSCKCDLRNTDLPPTAVPDGSPSGSAPQPGLDNNPGNDAKLFADSHPYVAHAYPGAREAVEKAVKESENENGSLYREVAKHVKEVKEQLDKYQGAIIESDKYLTGEIRVLRRSLADIMEHDREDSVLMQWLSGFTLEDMKGWKYEGWANNRTYEPGHPKYDPKNPNKTKHPETDYFLYYSKKIEGKKYWANVKMHKDYDGEVLYTIEPKKPEDLIKGKPKKKNDGMR